MFFKSLILSLNLLKKRYNFKRLKNHQALGTPPPEPLPLANGGLIPRHPASKPFKFCQKSPQKKFSPLDFFCGRPCHLPTHILRSTEGIELLIMRFIVRLRTVTVQFSTHASTYTFLRK